MKKIIALALTLVLVLSMSVTVFATGATNGVSGDIVVDNRNNSSATSGESQSSVSITIDAGNNFTPDKIYYVVVEWAEMEFTYTFGTTSPVWDPITHTYSSTSTDQGWLVNGSPEDTASIESVLTVANHSNANVNIATTVESTKQGITVNLNKNATYSAADNVLDTADTDARIGNYGDADRLIYDVSVSGTPTDFTAVEFAITVTITPAV